MLEKKPSHHCRAFLVVQPVHCFFDDCHHSDRVDLQVFSVPWRKWRRFFYLFPPNSVTGTGKTDRLPISGLVRLMAMSRRTDRVREKNEMKGQNTSFPKTVSLDPAGVHFLHFRVRRQSIEDLEHSNVNFWLIPPRLKMCFIVSTDLYGCLFKNYLQIKQTDASRFMNEVKANPSSINLFFISHSPHC